MNARRLCTLVVTSAASVLLLNSCATAPANSDGGSAVYRGSGGGGGTGPAPEASCSETAAAPTQGATPTHGNPVAREAAQKGLDFLADQAPRWQAQHGCYGCHVHAVTVEAMSVGLHNQYKVEQPVFSTILDGMLTIPGGSRSTPGGMSYHNNSLWAPSKAFGGAAFASYDALVDQKLTDDLLTVAAELLEYQQADGSINLGWVNQPVGVGPIEGTYQAIATWKQCYDRTADDKWLTAVQKAEGYLQKTIDPWFANAPADNQHVNYAILGLLSAGVGSKEATIVEMRRIMLERQNADGGWGMSKGAASSPFTTGQTLFVLRKSGMTDQDEPIARGTKWLIDRQMDNGGWSSGGFGKAEAMWGVLGLVSIDVVTVAVKGLQYGQHLSALTPIEVSASDNKGRGVQKIEVFVDDIRRASECGAALNFQVDPAGLETGKHIIDVVATNAEGKVSSRRFEVFAGDHYLTQIGTATRDNGTEVSLRNIAPSGVGNKVKVEIYIEIEGKDGVPVRGDRVRTFEPSEDSGPLSFFWDGKTDEGKAAASGRYIAEIKSLGTDGVAHQRAEVTFVNASPEEIRQNYGEITGGLEFADEQVAGAASNAEIELIDEKGNVVSRTRSTAQGQYRFKNVKKGKFKVRVKKKGFKAKDIDVAAKPAAVDEAAPMMLEAE